MDSPIDHKKTWGAGKNQIAPPPRSPRATYNEAKREVNYLAKRLPKNPAWKKYNKIIKCQWKRHDLK